MFFAAELIVIGAVTGLLSGMLGAGGGFLFVPLLTLVGVPMRSAAGLSLLYVACVATSGAVTHYRQGTADVKVAAAAIPGGVVAVPLGSYCSAILSNDLLQVIFGLTVLGGALALHWQSTHRSQGSSRTTASGTSTSRLRCPRCWPARSERSSGREGRSCCRRTGSNPFSSGC